MTAAQPPHQKRRLRAGHLFERLLRGFAQLRDGIKIKAALVALLSLVKFPELSRSFGQCELSVGIVARDAHGVFRPHICSPIIAVILVEAGNLHIFFFLFIRRLASNGRQLLAGSLRSGKRIRVVTSGGVFGRQIAISRATGTARARRFSRASCILQRAIGRRASSGLTRIGKTLRCALGGRLGVS